jgi:hypothetical protein
MRMGLVLFVEEQTATHKFGHFVLHPPDYNN